MCHRQIPSIQEERIYIAKEKEILLDFQFIPCYWDNMKEKNVLVSFQHRSGENENDVYVLTSKKESKKSDKALIKEAFWGVANFDKSMNEYWISDTDVASVESKDDITEDEIKVLRKFGIVYGGI